MKQFDHLALDGDDALAGIFRLREGGNDFPGVLRCFNQSVIVTVDGILNLFFKSGQKIFS